MKKIGIKVTTAMDHIELLKQTKIHFAVSATSGDMTTRDPNFIPLRERVEKVSFEFVEKAPELDFMALLKEMGKTMGGLN